MIDLNKYINKKVVVQFKHPEAMLKLHSFDGGKQIDILIAKGPQGPNILPPTPFIIGEVIGRDTLAIVRTKDETGRFLDVEINPDCILCVTVTVPFEEEEIKKSSLIIS